MNTAQNLKQQFKKSAQQFADEPLEILQSAKSQIRGGESMANYDSKPDFSEEQDKIEKEEKLKQDVYGSDRRNIEALQAEMRDIRRQKLFQSLLEKIQSGEYVAIEEFSELSYEQKDVLKAHLQNFKEKQTAQTENKLVEPTPKKSRRFLGGQRQTAQKQTTRVEKPVPPSG